MGKRMTIIKSDPGGGTVGGVKGDGGRTKKPDSFQL